MIKTQSGDKQPALIPSSAKMIFVLLFCTVMLTACGQAGSLYLPDNPQEPTSKKTDSVKGAK